MRIGGVRIENYKSLKLVELTPLGNLTILAGKNSSGKSNLLEVLDQFFADLDGSLERTISGVNDSLWFDNYTWRPISIRVDFVLDDDEKADFYPEWLLQRKSPPTEPDLRIERTLSVEGANMALRTRLVSAGGVELVRDGKPLGSEALGTTVPAEVLSTLPPNFAQQAFVKMCEILHASTHLVVANRDRPGTRPQMGARTPLLDEASIASIALLGQSARVQERKKWGQIRDYFESLSPFSQRLEPIPSQIFVAELDLHVPLGLTGGGTQAVLGLVHKLAEDAPILLVEEPENHLHPELVKRVLKFLRNESESGRQLLVSTHSPFMLDRVEVESIWQFTKSGKETKARRLTSRADFKDVILELGVKPSDVLFADAVVIAEGTTEKYSLPILASKVEMDFERLGIQVLPARGKGKVKYHLKMWAEIAADVDIPVYALVDADARTEAEAVVRAGLMRAENCVVLDEAAGFEDLYPETKLKQGFREEFGVELPEKVPKKGRAKFLKETLEKEGKIRDGWKVSLALRVTPTMSRDEVPAEVRRLLDRIGFDLARRLS